jgi:hypothetical protein
LGKADRVLTRDPEIMNLIGSTDDDLLFELRKETAEQKMSGKDPKKPDIDALMKGDNQYSSIPKESPKNTAEDQRQKQAEELKVRQEQQMRAQQMAAANQPKAVPQNVAPQIQVPVQHPGAPAANPQAQANMKKGQSPSQPRKDQPGNTSLFGGPAKK